MKNVFDIIEAIEEKVAEVLEKYGRIPAAIALSPGSYRRLLEIRSTDVTVGNLIIGCVPLNELETSSGRVSVVIDEMLSDTCVEVHE